MGFDETDRKDWLALERTNLANERTFLAYFRTFIVFLSSGFVIIKLEILSKLLMLGYFFVFIAVIVLVVGIARFAQVKSKLKRFSS